VAPEEPQALESLEAVYYSGQVPDSCVSLTLLGFIFDRIHFPGVYMPPPDRLDYKELEKETQRIAALGHKDVDTYQLINCLVFARDIKYLRDFCVFDGKPGVDTAVDEMTPKVALALEEIVFGPMPENFIPVIHGNFFKGLPGDDAMEVQVNFPRWSSYCANALIYSMKNQIPLINDNPSLPVPGVPGQAKNNAKLLTTILTIESVRLALPKLKALTPEQLKDFRTETADYVKPFRLAMLRMAKDLNGAITSDITLREVQESAKFLIDTVVYPELSELERIMHDPGKPWYRRAVDLAKSAPEIVTSFSALPKNIALAMLFARIAGALADVRDEQRDKEHKLGRTGLHFLLKLKQN
jgi:hypothetical protein